MAVSGNQDQLIKLWKSNNTSGVLTKNLGVLECIYSYKLYNGLPLKTKQETTTA